MVVKVLDENELVRLAASGDEEAFMMLASQCRDTIGRVAYFIARNRDEADDIASESFLRAWVHIRTKKPDIPFRIWVARIAKNLAIDKYRRSKQNIPQEVWFEPDLPAEVIDVRKALLDLPVDQRMAVTLMYFDDMSVSDIARVMGIPEGTVKSRVFLAKEKMRKRLGDD